MTSWLSASFSWLCPPVAMAKYSVLVSDCLFLSFLDWGNLFRKVSIKGSGFQIGCLTFSKAIMTEPGQALPCHIGCFPLWGRCHIMCAVGPNLTQLVWCIYSPRSKRCSPLRHWLLKNMWVTWGVPSLDRQISANSRSLTRQVDWYFISKMLMLQVCYY